ncbi:MAG TPA: ROK family protein, partial [Rubrivivax sp.]|nr:ROK family protein [Rubrivivax sp.]
MHALGIDLGGTKIEALLLSAQGETLWRRRMATPADDYHATLQAIAALVDEARVAGGGDC